MKRMIVFLLGLGLAVFAVAGRPLMDERALMDSLRAVNPRLRASWLRARGFPDATRPSLDSQGLRVVGRWSFGPSYDVDCRMTPAETLIALGRGSGVSLLRFSRSDTAEFQSLSDINSAGLINRVRLADTLLLVGTGAGVETYSISDERSPVLRSTLLTPLNDFAMRESLLYVMGCDDSFKVYSIADPANPRRLGACRDSGGPVAIAGNTAFVGDRWGLYAIDVSNPANPHRVGSWGTFIISVEARGNICCVTEYDPDSVLFFVLDVTNPASMHQLSTLRGAGGDALHLDGQYVYTAGGYGFQILDIGDSLNARIVGSCPLSVYKDGVWGKAGYDRAFVANEINGLAAMDDGDISHPLLDTTLLGAGSALDLDVRGSLCYVADEGGGMKLLDLSDPTIPHTLGELDTIGGAEACYSVVATDSFAFMGWFNTPFFRVADISEPTRPAFVGSCDPFEYAQDMVLRDSYVYCAENYKFQVVNVSQPSEPQVVGTLALPDYTNGMCLRDTLAYVTTYPLEIICVANPDTPRVVGSIPRGAWNVDVQDTLAYVAGGNGLFTYSVANPAAPYELDSLGFNSNTFDVVVVDTLAFVSTRSGLFMVNVTNPRSPVILGQHSLPWAGWRVEYAAPYVYVATQDAGICIFETTSTGLTERTGPAPLETWVRVMPNPTHGSLELVTTSSLGPDCQFSLFDASGREVALVSMIPGSTNERRTRIELGHLAPGAYFLRAGMEVRPGVLKIVKQ
jgi:hypothetical protein